MALIERDGVQLHFSEVGTGRVLLFHTGGGGDGQMWTGAGYPDRITGTRHILFDHRGHGRSSRPRDLDSHHIEEYVQDVMAVLDAAEVDRAVLVGYSAGADVVLRVAARAPSRCAAIVGIGAPPQPDDHSDRKRVLASHLRRVGMRDLMEELSASEPEPAPPWLIDNLAGTDTEMFALQLEAWAEAPNVWECLPDIEAPTLLIVGELEQGGAGSVERALQRLSRGQATVSPGYAHLQNFWHSEVTGPIISRFLASANTNS